MKDFEILYYDLEITDFGIQDSDLESDFKILGFGIYFEKIGIRDWKQINSGSASRRPTPANIT